MNTIPHSLNAKIAAYKQVLDNTQTYRKAWPATKEQIVNALNEFLQTSGIRGKVNLNTDIENLEAVTLDLGRSSSGISRNHNDSDVRNFMIKVNGALIYQQLFNGKLMVMVQQPFIEGQVDPKEPQFIEILTPEELNLQAINSHLETLLEIITNWEDFDDEGPQKKTVFQPIGFQHGVNTQQNA